MPKLNDDIPLKFQLGLEETNKYVRAYVTDEDDVAISGSPFALTHVSGGLYTKLNVAMPNKTSVTARYFVYDDSGFTTRTAGYEPVIETFELTPTPASGEIVSFDIDVEIEQQNEIEVEIEEC